MATYYYWTGSGVTARANSTAYTAGARVVIALTQTTGNHLVARRYVWECTTGGTSGAAVPTWPATVTADTTTLTDGTVTWTARNPGYSSGTTVNWTFATIYIDYALRAANTNGDLILVHYTSQEEFTANTTITTNAHVQIISVDKDASNAVTAMGASGWIGNSTTARQISFTTSSTAPAQRKALFYGITFRSAGSAQFTMNICNGVFSTTSLHAEFDNCYFWHGDTNANSGIRLGGDNTSGGFVPQYIKFSNCTFRFGATTQGIIFQGTARCEFVQCSISADGSIPNTLFQDGSFGTGITDIKVTACDLSLITGTLLQNVGYKTITMCFDQCKLGANVTVLATQSSFPHKASGIAYVFDCSSGDTHGLFGYYDAFGSCVSVTGIYYSTGVAGQSWKIVTTANCSYYTPFVSPFVDFYNTGTSSITPRFEILRDGSTTAFQDDEVWGEFFVKSTNGSTQSTPSSDRMALLGTPANQAAGAGTGSWTGEGANAWSGKVDSGSAVTPVENGHIRGRVVVGEPSITVYVDPQIRT